MDRSALTRKRQRDAPQPVRPSTSGSVTDSRARSPHKPSSARSRSQPAAEALEFRPHSSGKIRKARDSSEITRAKRGDGGVSQQEEMTAAEDDRQSQHFTVGGVGAGGTLYLTPSRLPPPQYTLPPIVPGRVAGRDSVKTVWPSARTSNVSAGSGARPRGRGSAYDHKVPVPPVSIANVGAKRRPRSHSFSTLSEHEKSRAPTLNSTDVQDFRFFLNGKRRSQSQRPKSYMNLGEGLLQHHIPHYRLGTPRFSARGTAYLHNSVYTMTTSADDANSSMFSRSEYDKLFPAPPGRPMSGAGTTYPYDTNQTTPTRTPPKNRMSLLAQSGVRTFVFEKIQANPNDPATVRFSAQTGKLAAATPARLIAQITSPDILDYELLSDFFLTYRGFLSSNDLLEYLLARMRWALGDAADSGRIARVRTFVALRHWILNYFQDDFLYDLQIRQRFCDLVNQMCTELSQRPDKGGGDLNILGELKKCWRRTCALFWQIPDAMETAVGSVIFPGGDQGEDAQVRASLLASPEAAQQELVGDSQQAALAPQVAAETGLHGSFHREPSMDVADSGRSPVASMHTPGSPMSDFSLQVVSCSVPFFSTHRQPPNPLKKVLAPRPAGSRIHPPVSLGQGRPSHQHKRSGSFSDALRDERTPLPSAKIDSETLRELPNMTLTAGLVRGLILQPSSAQVNVLVPTTPGPAATEPRRPTRAVTIDEPSNLRNSQQHLGVKRIVGDMRRALSTRKQNKSPARSQKSASSSSSKSSNPTRESPKQETNTKPAVTWEPSKGFPRTDMLGQAAAKAYEEAKRAEDAPRDSQSTPRPTASAHDSVKPDELGLLKRPDFDRALSQVTASSQSIMIVDATGPQDMPVISQSLPSVSTWSSTMTPAPLLSRSPGGERLGQDDYFGGYHNEHPDVKPVVAHDEYRQSSQPSLHGLLSLPDNWRITRTGIPYEYNPSEMPARARKSSGVQSPAFDMPPIRNPIRRVPGGDLKGVGHVHDLESEPRVQSTASMSTLSRSLPNEYDLSGTHFSGQGLPIHIASLPARTGPKESLGLLDTPSQPYIRKSIKEDAWRLAKMHDSSPGGGVEDALLKLEGRYAGRRASTQGLFGSSLRESGAFANSPSLTPAAKNHEDIMIGDMDLLSPTTDRQGASIYRHSASDISTPSRRNTASEDAEGIYEMDDLDESSTSPVLQRANRMTMFPIPSVNSTRPSCDEPNQPSHAAPDNLVRRATSRALNSDSDGSRPGASQMSFLLDDNQSLSEISTDLTDGSNGMTNLGVRSFFFDDTIEEESSRQPSLQPPFSPQATSGAPVTASPEQKIVVQSPDDEHNDMMETPRKPKTPTNGLEKQRLHPSQPDLQSTDSAIEQEPTAHLPFIFGYSSSVIAEQLTIIEKDALDEVDWKDLIGLNWHQNPPPVRNWVSYLRSSESDNGIDLVIARFNLVVKWIVSELVLTKSTPERARALTKFIHIASHALRLKNYASTYQITLALLSSDITRLKRTWLLVPTQEKTTLARLERLCQPVKNFAALRAEMEAASLAHGCIPFIGLYTHDLMYNAQKPARINPAPPGAAPSAARLAPRGHESLINFERYQTSAAIAKGLLRLLESSAQYGLKPESECLSRCLWLAALGDEEIAERSRGLE